MTNGAYDPPAFSIDGVVKDVGLMIDVARATGVRDDLLRAVVGLYADAAAAGHGDHDMSAVRTVF